jgi:hypothetical protein
VAINYVIDYTFAPGTTIASSQVNTNFSTNAAVWTGLESLTKTFAKLKVDVDPSTALEVATKQYVDHYSTYRRPVLQYSSGTVVIVETGIDGTSGDCRILFPDGNLRTDTSTSRIQCNLAQVAALSGTAQSGLRTGSQTANTWYSFYAVKTSDNTSNFVIVADVLFPYQSNFSTFNTNFGTNSWVYLGTLPNGDNSGATNVIKKFVMVGNTVFLQQATTTGFNVVGTCTGLLYATTAGATTLTYTLATGGTVGTQLPLHFILVNWYLACAPAAGELRIQDSSGSRQIATTACPTSNSGGANLWVDQVLGIKITNGASASKAQDIALHGYVDGVLGVGSNPIL